MSPSPPKKKNDGQVSAPRQIRFVSADGQPQTKRRRVNAARKIRCSGEQPVCKTCFENKHACLGYNDTPSHPRASADLAARSEAVPSGPQSKAQRQSTAAKSCSPEPNRIKAPEGVPDRSSHTSRVVSTSPANKDVDAIDTGKSPESGRTSMSSSSCTHVPYFRYFGPTAIVPGFKQMVVQVRGSRKSNASMSSESMSPLRSPKQPHKVVSTMETTLAPRVDSDTNTIPFYDRHDVLPVSNLVSHLGDLFFTHLGCNFPFLQRDRFLSDLRDKKVESMLVDAVCALAARFSQHPLLGHPQAPSIDGSEPPVNADLFDRGLPFAHRAMNALVDALSCPTLSAVQACLLLAYEQFGSNHDSGLWMYLGIAIRMAQDLGLQKIQGLKYNYGQRGVTPSAVMTGHAGHLTEEQYDDWSSESSADAASPSMNAERAHERERVDSFWSIFFLDRVISSGTGRPVTLRDEDIELCFPLQSESRLPNGWPAPFPPLIRIIHLYGRVTDLINGIRHTNNVTADTLKRLANMESDLTGIYQRLSPRLHFNAANFQTYVKAKEGTNFILLHFWFHTLIVLLHQPTLLHSFGGSIQHLYPNSRELSMSSAKTIADILSFSELVDGKSFIGNPFTSQPMYIAACAFLMESAYYSSPSSRAASPAPTQALLTGKSSEFTAPSWGAPLIPQRNSAAKHTLLATAAKENYQRCYKALQALDMYWKGTRYILTVLDQKAKGIVDPLLYTAEEMEHTVETASPEHAGSDSGKARNPCQLSPGTRGVSHRLGDNTSQHPASNIDSSQAIGWALTGATNSSQPNLSLLYQTPSNQVESTSGRTLGDSQYNHGFVSARADQSTSSLPASHGHIGSTWSRNNPSGYFQGMDSVYAASTEPSSTSRYSASMPVTQIPGNGCPLPSPQLQQAHESFHNHSSRAGHTARDTQKDAMIIESHDVDMNDLQQQESFPFTSSEILPWLEYLPQDVLSFFGDAQSYPNDGL
ncbi:Nitrogen assimilation transcription factor [Penicillium ucsense]|uniref:Nitrogen assimilation transcription factor n=1 Tax=Penicillium ucsense TaxID=2839758 RepID=A0A8J8WHH7_9EURO|nr:Nitrogen assimilation transcription factor [Penicillium ucsense]KAF7735557.1 Nitrogen assimilation transcription factor [Penicillium ucsense]